MPASLAPAPSSWRSSAPWPACYGAMGWWESPGGTRALVRRLRDGGAINWGESASDGQRSPQPAGAGAPEPRRWMGLNLAAPSVSPGAHEWNEPFARPALNQTPAGPSQRSLPGSWHRFRHQRGILDASPPNVCQVSVLPADSGIEQCCPGPEGVPSSQWSL